MPRGERIHGRAVGRPALLADGSELYLSTRNTKSKLYAGSERRAIVNYIVDQGGRVSLRQLLDHFGFDVRTSVNVLRRSGWLEAIQ